jgi:hypothetical protein
MSEKSVSFSRIIKHVIYYLMFSVSFVSAIFLSTILISVQHSIYRQAACLFLSLTVCFMIFEYIGIGYWKSVINPKLEYPLMADRTAKSLRGFLPDMDMMLHTRRLAGPSQVDTRKISGLKAAHRTDWVVSMDRMRDRVEETAKAD